jgi:spore coat polysaccharide biosynthesis protein SpsF
VSERAAIVLQARVGSTRLPGKVMAPIGGQTVLAHCVERLRATSRLRVIVATTTRDEDDCVAREARRLGADVLRGPAEDVLGRFALAARLFSLTEVIRATADNPAVDMEAPARALAMLRQTRSAHVVEYGLPYGTVVEAVSADALLRAAELTRDPFDREHVTPFVRRDARFHALQALGPSAVRRPDLRLTVDTADDLEWVRRVFGVVPRPASDPVPLARLIAAAGTLLAGVPNDRPSGVHNAR